VEVVCMGIISISYSALRLSAQTRGDRPCRYMYLASPLCVINSWCFSEEYHVYTVERVLDIWGISFHSVELHCISLHPLFLFEYVFFWCWTLCDIWLSVLMKTWLISIMWTCKIKGLFLLYTSVTFLYYQCMRYIGYT